MRRRIACIFAGLHSEYNHRLLEGLSDQAHTLGYDVCVYSFFDNRTNETPTRAGEENILRLIDPYAFDGFIIRKGSFQKTAVRNKITDICTTVNIPCVELDDPDPENAVYTLWNDRENFRRIVSHLITAHGCKKIYCITGYAGFHQSENRLQGYRDALLAHGITPDPAWEFYGDFWTAYAEQFAADLLAGKMPMPDAIACASTVAANVLIDKLDEGGVRIPEDVLVTGYDPCLESILSTSTVTSISDYNYNQGILAVCRLHHQITGKAPVPIPLHPEVVECGESCGCGVHSSPIFSWYKKQLARQLDYMDLFQSSCMLQNISTAENANEFSNALMNYDYLLRGVETVWLCLNDDWDGINNTVEPEHYRTEGYADQLFIYRHRSPYAHRYHIMRRTDLLSYLCKEDTPSTFFFLPLHYEDRAFGFITLRFQEAQYSPDKLVWNWLELVNNALETIRIRYYIRRFSDRIHLTAIRDPLTGIYNRRGFEELSVEMYEYATLHQENFLLVAVRIYNLREINRNCGYTTGDLLIITVADALNLSCRGNELCCRGSSGMFYLIGSHDTAYQIGTPHADRILTYCAKHLESIESKVHIEIDIETDFEKATPERPLHQIISSVQKSMEEKHIKEQKRITYLRNMADLRRQIYENPQDNWTVDRMAQMMMLSRAYFQRLYKKNFGVSAIADVITARVSFAKKMLRDPEKNIADIAELCGYSSEIYFMQQFKKETGYTPSGYRKTVNESGKDSIR